ncbi:MAG: hypothetical protein ACFFCS_29515 [Candidatus Hodarchaeota archaeon]
MVDFKRTDIETEWCSSLCWYGESVIDIFHGGVKYHLDGTIEEPGAIRRVYAYPFDSISSCGKHAVLYEALGTKGLLIDIEGQDDTRELNRSYYHARDYRYPITLFNIPDGRKVIAHCPEEYCSLELELVEGGEVLTKREYHSADVFHSDLMTSLDGRYLLDRGWVWHPWNIVGVYDVKLALEDPSHLDGHGLDVPQGGSLDWEPQTATFCGHKIVTASYTDSDMYFEGEREPSVEEDFELIPAEEGVPETNPDTLERIRWIRGSDITIVDSEGNPLKPQPTPKRPAGARYLLQVYDLDKENLISSREMPEMPGRMMSLGKNHVLSLFDHPKVIEIETGKVVLRIEDLFPGPEQEQPSAMMQDVKEPYLALDPRNNRFAIGTEKKVTIIEIKGL